MQLIDPFPGLYDSSDPFGSLAGGRSYPHTGSDWFAPNGAPIPAIGSGVVVNAQWHSGNGNTVTVKLPDGHYYAYLHMSGPAAVSPGQQVSIGQTLGYVGDTGANSRGAHLHVTVSDTSGAYGGLGNLIDPWAFIQANLTEDDMFTDNDRINLQALVDGSRPFANGYPFPARDAVQNNLGAIMDKLNQVYDKVK